MQLKKGLWWRNIVSGYDRYTLNLTHDEKAFPIIVY